MESQKGLDYILVLDFEAQCLEGKKLECQEIVEFPVVVIDVAKKEIVKDFQFHYYVKPTVVPEVTQFCTELTGITQSMVDKGKEIQEVLKLFDKHLKDTGISEKN